MVPSPQRTVARPVVMIAREDLAAVLSVGLREQGRCWVQRTVRLPDEFGFSEILVDWPVDTDSLADSILAAYAVTTKPI